MIKEYTKNIDWSKVYKFVLSDNRNKESEYKKVNAELKKFVPVQEDILRDGPHSRNFCYSALIVIIVLFYYCCCSCLAVPNL